jgi:hypothetical protein
MRVRYLYILSIQHYNFLPLAQWNNSLRTTDAGWRLFIDSCVAAGPDNCELYDLTTDKILDRLEKLYAALKARPIPITPLGSSTDVGLDYGVLDYGIVRRVIFRFLFKPFAPGPLNATALAGALATAEKGDGRPMWTLYHKSLQQPALDCQCGVPPPPRRPFSTGTEANLAVACSEGDVVADSLAELHTHFERMAKMSSFAELWHRRIECS